MYLRNILRALCISIVTVVLVTPTVAFMKTPLPPKYTHEPTTADDPRDAFRSRIFPTLPSLIVPTVVEVPLVVPSGERTDVAVYDVRTGTYLPYYIHEQYIKNPVPLSVESNGTGNSAALLDGTYTTGVRYDLPPGGGLGTAEITLRTSEPIDSSSLTVSFGASVRLPKTVSVSVVDQYGIEQIVVAPTSMTSEQLRFLKTTGQIWKITLIYAQPLEITEVNLVQDSAESSVTRGVRFLAQPGTDTTVQYILYTEPDRYVAIQKTESGNLADSRGVVIASVGMADANPHFVPADTDADGVRNTEDNCDKVANPDQLDVDQNGVGDVCDDFDRDDVSQATDNCPNHPNNAQEDVDNDGMGDVCDGEDNRITEQYPWIPWVGIGVAALVIAVLFFLVATTEPRKQTLA